MVIFQTKNPNLDKFLSSVQWKMSVYFMTLGSFYDYWVYFVAIRYFLWTFGILFSRFGMLH
jgi:hypothetical protein